MSAVQARPADLAVIRSVLACQPKVRRAWVYGSRARGDAGRGADIDLAIEAPIATPVEFSRLRAQLDDSALILRFDLVRLDDLPDDSPLRRNVESDAKLIYQAGE